MSERDADNSKETVRRLADFEASAAAESRAKLIDEHSAAFRWMIASLFALNGGAILTIVGSDKVGLQPSLPAFWVFFGGVVSTFLAVFFAQLSDRSMIARMHSWGLYWTKVGTSAQRDIEAEEELKTGIMKAERLGRWARIHAIFAMLFFVLGVLTAVVAEQGAEIQKLKLERDRIEAAQEAAIDKLEAIETQIDRLEAQKGSQ